MLFLQVAGQFRFVLFQYFQYFVDVGPLYLWVLAMVTVVGARREAGNAIMDEDLVPATPAIPDLETQALQQLAQCRATHGSTGTGQFRISSFQYFSSHVTPWVVSHMGLVRNGSTKCAPFPEKSRRTSGLH